MAKQNGTAVVAEPTALHVVGPEDRVEGAALQALLDAHVTMMEEMQRLVGVLIDMQNRVSKWYLLSQTRLYPLAIKANELSLRSAGDLLGRYVDALRSPESPRESSGY
jgi:hypothetical protein